MVKYWLTLALLILVVLILPGGLQGQEPDPADNPAGDVDQLSQGVPTDQIIIKFKDPGRAHAALTLDSEQLMVELSQAAGVPLSYYRPMSGQATVLKLPETYPLAEVEAISASLSALPKVEYAEPDRIYQVIGRPTFVPGVNNVSPDDPAFGSQWHYGYTANTAEGLNLLPAWGITTGAASTTVAVIDTGILNHADLSGRVLDGYDFITNVSIANDGDGRDADPADPGDWVTTNECGIHPPKNSSWHGTHVAGTIGAATNNGVGVAGVNWAAKILPVRVLGKCGGNLSDIIDGSRWAAGLPVVGAPANPHPARVLNLSLGGTGLCSVTEQNAFTEIVNAGVTVVIAAGNNNADATGYSPGNCEQVVTVAANTRTGNKAWYSNFGSKVEVAAPGGETDIVAANGILSTLNGGTMGPGADNYAYYQGTSMAAPHVAGLASLILGLRPDYTPAQMLARLQVTARPFPAGSICISQGCGAGIVDAFQALSGLSVFQQHAYLPVIFQPEQTRLPQIHFSEAVYNVNEAAGAAVIEVRLSEVTNDPVTVAYGTGGGTATPGVDYVPTSGTLHFDPGQTSKSFSVTILDNLLYEVDESIGLSLSNPDRADLGVPAQATLNIINDDIPFEPLINGGFEQQTTGWIQYSSHGWELILEDGNFPGAVQPHGGDWAVWLGGDFDDISYVAQQVVVPAGAPYFTYWHWIASEDDCGFDLAGVVVNGSEVADVYSLCSSANTGGWEKHAVDLSTWINQTIVVQIRVVTDGINNSNMFVDDVSFEVSAADAGAPPDAGPGPGVERAAVSRRDLAAANNEIVPEGAEQPLFVPRTAGPGNK